MKARKSSACLLILVVVGLVFNGCRKTDRDKDKDTSAVMDHTLAESVFQGIYKSIGEYVDSSSYLRSVGYPVYTVDSVGTASWPKTLTIDFGPTNVMGSDGVNRKGKIVAAFTHGYRDSLAVITISLLNYYHNDNLIQTGTHTLTNKGRNAAGNLSYAVFLQNASITNSANQIIKWNAYRTREWIAGANTAMDASDDVYLLTGFADGTAINGNTFNVKIDVPLHVASTCRWIEQGVLTLTAPNLSERAVDFGNGSCDAQAIVVINSDSQNITMK